MMLWRRADLLRLSISTGLGFVILSAGWLGVSGTARVSHQAPWVTLGAAGVLAIGGGNILWLLRGRRAIGERRRLLLRGFEHLAPPTLVQPADGAAPRPVSAHGMTHYHRPDCQLVQEKPTTSATVATHKRAGRRPCGMCQS